MIPRRQLEELHPQRIVDEKKVPRRTNHLRTEADGGKATPENLVAALQATKHPPRLLDATSAEYPSPIYSDFGRGSARPLDSFGRVCYNHLYKY